MEVKPDACAFDGEITATVATITGRTSESQSMASRHSGRSRDSTTITRSMTARLLAADVKIQLIGALSWQWTLPFPRFVSEEREAHWRRASSSRVDVKLQRRHFLRKANQPPRSTFA